jgi:hypothetical protein
MVKVAAGWYCRAVSEGRRFREYGAMVIHVGERRRRAFDTVWALSAVSSARRRTPGAMVRQFALSATRSN